MICSRSILLLALGASVLHVQATTLAAKAGFQRAPGAVTHSSYDKMQGVASFRDFGAQGGIADDTKAMQAALSSGARYVIARGMSWHMTSLTVPANVTLDCQGGTLITSAAANEDVLVTGGAGVTIKNCMVRSRVAGRRQGRYGVLVAHAGATLANLAFKDITYTAVFNDADGTTGRGLSAENCGWDLLSNYQHAKNGKFSQLVAVRNGRSAISTDVGAADIVVDGFSVLDNGLDSTPTEHKDVIHFEGATNMVVRNGTIRYSAAYDQGKILQTWAILRWNSSVNATVQNVRISVAATAHGRMLLGLVDGANTRVQALDIDVDASAIPAFPLTFLSYDGAARFKLTGGVWNGNVGIESATAGGRAFSDISNIDASGPGTGTFMTSHFVTNGWAIARIKLRGYSTAFRLNGFQDSSIRHSDITGATAGVFILLNSNAAPEYQPEGGSIDHNVVRGPTGTILQTNHQRTRSLVFADNTIEGAAAQGLDTAGGKAGATAASVKATGNRVAGAVRMVHGGGANAPGALDRNLNLSDQ